MKNNCKKNKCKFSLFEQDEKYFAYQAAFFFPPGLGEESGLKLVSLPSKVGSPIHP